jgi:hypothetical protein
MDDFLARAAEIIKALTLHHFVFIIFVMDVSAFEMR